MEDSALQSEASRASYTVGAAPPPNPPSSRYALFFTHGMGQPLPFQTIDQVSSALYKLDCDEKHTNPKPNAVTVKVGDDWLNRIEMRLKSGAEAVEVHLYEGYWAPMTEGKIGVRQVMGFLAGAGLNALRHTTGEFNRWLFGKFPSISIPIRHVFFLLIALATVASLVVLNGTIAVVAAARALLGVKPGWLTDNLFADLTTTFNLVVMALGSFGLSLLVAVLLRKRPQLLPLRTPWSFVTLILFGVALLVVMLAGLGIPPLLYAHVRGLAGALPIWHRFVEPDVVKAFNDTFDAAATRYGVLLAGYVVGQWTGKILNGVRRDVKANRTARDPQRGADGFLLLALALASLAVIAAHFVIERSPGGAAFAQSAVAWPLLVAASALIRLLLVQYVGDVAIYIMPYKLDLFTELRREIKLRVYKAARAVYAQKEYRRVIVVGHSLGSVIAYDALNMLILEDRSIQDAKKSEKRSNERKKPSDKPKQEFLDVVNRTSLFLTFGCPLDKTAFVFAVQARGTSEAREALAGSVQPLIVDYKYRPRRWINIWSPWDIISGPLDLYDFPLKARKVSPGTTRPAGHASAKRVHNERDPEATTLLVAHTEYWENPLLVKTIYDALDARASAPRR